MENDAVLYSSKDGIARITLNRPKSLNAFNKEVITGLGEALDMARGDKTANMVVLTGQGSSFCAGGDLGELQRMSQATTMEIYDFMADLNEVVKKLIQLPKALLTAVNGAALGGGSCLALAGDVVIAVEKATFGFVFSRFNLVADTGSSFLLPRLVGSIRARELILSGRMFSAKEAEEYGLVSQVVSKDIFDETVMNRAREMAEWPAEAVRMNKWLLEKAEGGCDLEMLLELEARTQAALFASPVTGEKIRAFLEKSMQQAKGKA